MLHKQPPQHSACTVNDAARPCRDAATVQLAALLEALPQPALLLDTDATVLTANARALGDFPGLEEGRALHIALRDRALQAALDRLAQGTSQSESLELMLTRPLPRRLHARLTTLPCTDGSSRIAAILLLLHDVSEAEKLARSRMAFIASASHELRTPLASILGIAETLLGPARDDAAAREEFLQHMLRQARRMQQLVDDMLSLACIEQQEHQPPEEVIDINPIARRALETLRPRAEETGVQLQLELMEPRALVRGDAGQIEQIIVNLLENAITYGASGGRVRLRVRRRVNKRGVPYIAVTVRDWGPGIDARHIPHLTERFYRVDKQLSRNHGGTGLGLAIVKHLVQRHRGRLKISSRPGKGAKFTVRLPAINGNGVMPVNQDMSGD